MPAFIVQGGNKGTWATDLRNFFSPHFDLATGARIAGQIVSADILDGTIVNADIAAGTAIVDTKLATIATAGKVSDSALSNNIPLLNAANVFTVNPTVSVVNARIAIDANPSGFPVVQYKMGGVISGFVGTDSVNGLVFLDIVAATKVKWDLSTNPGTLLTGIVPDARLTSNIPLLNAVADFTNELKMTSTTRPFTPPRMTTVQRDLIASPTAGMVIYNTTTNVLNFRNATIWGAV